MSHFSNILKGSLATFARLLILASILLPNMPANALQDGAGSSPAQSLALTNTITLSVFSARDEPYFNANPGGPPGPGITKGTPVTGYKFMINVDNTGNPQQSRYPDCSPYLDQSHTTPNPDYPARCDWPSIHAQQALSQIITQGDQTILNDTTSLTLPDGKYLISVLADGFKIDGQWFTLPMATDPVSGKAVVKVGVQPLPLPTATIRIKVFEDISPTNSAPDLPAEHGLAGFFAHIADQLGETTTDVYGNPICTQYYTTTAQTLNHYQYDASGKPVPVPGSGGKCVSDVNGDIVIPNLGPNRWAVSVIPPDGSDWIQTTTLEGNKDWDTWVQEGYTGYDTEFTLAGEPFPFTIFGFVRPTSLAGHADIPVTGSTSKTGEIKGVVSQAKVYVPYNGGLPYQGGLWGGLSGARIEKPVDSPYIALTDLGQGDTAVYVGRGKPDGSFDIKGVPDGSYTLSYWDEPINNIFDLVNVTVKNGEVVDMGALFLTGWFSTITGHVFLDENANGKMDPGEHGIEGYPIVVKNRSNAVMDRGSTGAITTADGSYMLENMYPLTRWTVLEAYTDNYYVTGVTFQADNQPQATTVTPANGGVDVNVLPIIGQGGRLDWGVKPYAPGTNGGIVGTVSYDTTRNELDPRYAAVEAWQPGVPNLKVKLYAPVRLSNGGYLTVTNKADPNYGALVKGALLNEYDTETWGRPKNCVARDVDGKPVSQMVLPPATGDHDCIEAPLMGTQFESGFSTVDGNYGFTTVFTPSMTAPGAAEVPMPVGDYLVEVEIPNDSFGRPLYKVTKEEDINIFGGDVYHPQAPTAPNIPPSVCAGPLHIVDVAGVGIDGPNAVNNPPFRDAGGSPYEGQSRPLCNMKLVTVSNQRSVAPSFNLFTDVPIPGRWFGLILDDLNLSTNPQDLLFGEKAGVPNSPIGVYDAYDRLLTTVNSDPNGFFDVLLPSTSTINCPSPSGVCANVYRIVGNDPGQPGQVNANYNPQFRTISANFEVFPGTIIPADLAPTQVGVSIQSPGSQTNYAVTCKINPAPPAAPTTPEFFSVDKPYIASNATGAAREVTITGYGFGATQGTGSVSIGTISLPVITWSDTQIKVRIPSNATPGARQLNITNNNQKTAVNSLTFHVLGGNYQPNLFIVGPGKPYDVDPNNPVGPIQRALNDASARRNALVVVYPGTPSQWNPRGAYFENIIVHSPVRLQGVGPGGTYADNTYVPGSILSGLMFGGDTGNAQTWRAQLANLNWVGNQDVAEGAVVTVLAEQQNQFTTQYRAQIDGFNLEGGDQQGFPNNINQIGGTPNGLPAAVVVQGGGIYVNAYAHYLQISNNILQNNGGAYGGAIRVGNPDLPLADGSNSNDGVRIVNNQVIANGGTNLAGGIGIFRGANGYEISSNLICGNFSAEYGGGISHYGYSPNGQISSNRIYFNRSYDEGGGVMIAGELPADPTALSPGAGPVKIFNNIIQANLANDDGGGIRFLMAGNFTFDVYNNMITNNVSTHEGGGISLNDAPSVRVYDNTLMKNITTATAATSTGAPAPAGLSSSQNSTMLQATLPPGSPIFSKPLLFNNIFWDNRAGTWNGGTVSGIGLTGDPNPINYWDLGVADNPGGWLLEPTNSTLQTANSGSIVPSATNLVNVDPQVVSMYDTSVGIMPWRTNPHFVGVNLVAVEMPPLLMGDYHLQTTSQAINAGALSKNNLNVPNRDIDGDPRPDVASRLVDIGADEVGPLSAPALLQVIPQAQFNLVFGNTLFLPFTSSSR